MQVITVFDLIGSSAGGWADELWNDIYIVGCGGAGPGEAVRIMASALESISPFRSVHTDDTKVCCDIIGPNSILATAYVPCGRKEGEGWGLVSAFRRRAIKIGKSTADHELFSPSVSVLSE